MIFSYTIEIRLISYCNPVSMPKSENATWNKAICRYRNKIYIRLSHGNKILLRLIPENQERESDTYASATFRIKILAWVFAVVTYTNMTGYNSDVASADEPGQKTKQNKKTH